MLPDFDDKALEEFAAARIAIVKAQAEADTFARSKLDAASAHLTALLDGQNRLGAPPAADAFTTAAEWREAEDQHTFASRRYAREIGEAEQKLAQLRTEHQQMLEVIPALRRQLLKRVLAAMNDRIVTQIKETARLAAVRQSLLNRVPREEWHGVLGEVDLAAPHYKAQHGGYADVSTFQASAMCDGIGPDKSAALAAELPLF